MQIKLTPDQISFIESNYSCLEYQGRKIYFPSGHGFVKEENSED